MTDENDPVTPDGEGPDGDPNIVARALSAEMETSYLQYAMSVIKSRALPDVRDGLKPSQRRVLYTFHMANLGPGSQRKKSANVVGTCMANYHPHGDAAIYATLVRMAQPFNSRYVMVDPKGNFGSISDPSPAAMRYTECRMARAGADMVEDIKLDTVDMQETFEGGGKLEPSVLPSKFPNLLCNGSQGIAVGMATSIPPHNLREVVSALTALVRKPDMSVKELMEHIPGPDFPTGGVICGTSGIRQAYQTGKGHVTLRAKVEVDTVKDKATIKVTELPYMVTTENLKEKISEAHNSGRVEGISGLQDHSAGGKVDLRVVCKKGEDPEVILNQLYKFTPLQTTFSVNMIALDEQGTQPRQFELRGLLQAFIDHRLVVIRRRTEFKLKEALERIHVLIGLVAALDKIDAVIETIRSSQSTEEARGKLRELLQVHDTRKDVMRAISVAQADAILAMRLARLVGLEREKLAKELEELRAAADDYRDIIKSRERKVEIFATECQELVARDYSSEPQSKAAKATKQKLENFIHARRSNISLVELEDIDIEDLIADEEAVVTVTHKGWIKRTALDAYRVQGRAGKGLYGASNKDDDFVELMFQASTKDFVLAFTSHGRVHWLKVYQIPEGSRTARGRGLRNLIALYPDESVTSLIPVKDFPEDQFVAMATAEGVIKKTSLKAFSRPKKGGILAVKLDEGDRLVGVRITDGQRELVLASRQGKAIRFQEKKVRAMGRVSRGVKGMELAAGDAVVSLVMVGEEGNQLLTVCEYGYGKRTEVEDYRETNRGGKGIINIKTTERNGLVAGVISVTEGDQVMLITSAGKLIRTACSEISLIGRATQGVRLMKIDDGERVVAVTKIRVTEEDIAAENAAAAEEQSEEAGADE